MNTRYRKFFIFAGIILLAAVSFAAEQKVYIAGVNNNNNTLELQDIVVTVSNLVEEMPFDNDSAYSLELVSANNKVLYKTKFDFTLIYEYKEITIPYFENGKEIRVYDKDGNTVLNESVIQFAKTCPDNTCEPHESYESCTADCPSGGKDDYCDSVKDGLCDPDCSASQDTDCKPASTGTGIAIDTNFLAGISIVMISFAIFGYWRAKQKKRVSRILKKLR